MKDTVRNIPSSIVFKDENVIVIVFDFGMSIADSIFWIFDVDWMFYYLLFIVVMDGVIG